MEDHGAIDRADSLSTPGASGAREGWLPKDELCEMLEISPRTVDRMVSRGELLRRRAGRESRFRIVDASRAPVNAVEGTPQARAVIEQREDLESAQRYIAQLVGVVDKLAERVANLERERAELIAALSSAGKVRTVVGEGGTPWTAAKPS